MYENFVVQVGDNESARKYIEGYLAEKDSHVIAHKLAGKQHAVVVINKEKLSNIKNKFNF